jgi:hypothetical protein
MRDLVPQGTQAKREIAMIARGLVDKEYFHVE